MNSTTTMLRMIPKFWYSFLPIVMPFSPGRLFAVCLLMRFELEFHHARALYLSGLKTPLPDCVESGASQHRMSAHYLCILHRAVWRDYDLNLHRAGDIHPPRQIGIHGRYFDLGPAHHLA